MDEISKNFKQFCDRLTVYDHKNKKGLIPLELYDYQIRYADFLDSNNCTIATKFRQGGFTTISLAYILHKLLLNDNRRAACTSISYLMLGELFNVVKNFANQLNVIEDSRNWPNYIKLINGSSIHFNKCCQIEDKIDYLYLDEMAYQYALTNENMMLGICNPHTIVVSTPNKTNGWFYETYKDAIHKKNKFKVFFAEYTENPVLKENKEKYLNNMGQKYFRVEMLQEFSREDGTFESFVAEAANQSNETLMFAKIGGECPTFSPIDFSQNYIDISI